MRSVLAVLLLAALAACGDDDSGRECSTSADCLQGGINGTCLPSPASDKKWCAFPDPDCGSGERWGLLAGDGLESTCVESGADAGPDASVGTATLDVMRDGTGGGAVVSSPEGVDCGETCSADFPVGTEVTLMPTAEAGASFTGWAGDCEGAGGCTIVMDEARTVVARFDNPAEKLWLRHVLTAATSALAVDASGDIVAAGTYDGSTVDFGGGIMRTSDGAFAFVAKLSGSTGATLWVADFGGIGNILGKVTGVAVDGAGDVVVVGSFTGSNLVIGEDTFGSEGNEDIFVVKLSGSDGSVVWARTFGSASIERALSVAAGAGNNIVVVGQFNGTIDFDSEVLTANDRSFDAFMVRLSGAAGATLWADRFGGTENDGADAVAVRDGVVALAGHYRGQANFGGTSLPQQGDSEIVIATYQEVDGSFVWSSGYGGTGTDRAHAVALHSDGNVYVAGEVSGTDVTLGDEAFDAVRDIFVAKYSPAGNHVWSKPFGDSSTGADIAKSIAVGPTGDVVAVGEFRSSVNFGGGALLASGMSPDIFLVRLSSDDGAHVWSRRFGGAGNDFGSAVALDALGSAVAGGAVPTVAEFYDEALTGAGAWILKVAP